MPFITQNKFEGKPLTLSTTIFFNNPSVDNWFSFLIIKYSLVNSSYWQKVNAKAESENQNEIEDTRLVLKK